jgi:hypothetical protein
MAPRWEIFMTASKFVEHSQAKAFGIGGEPAGFRPNADAFRAPKGLDAGAIFSRHGFG